MSETLTLVILAAGLGSRYGSVKQIAAVGPHGETLVDYAVYDALRAGFSRVLCIIRHDIERDFRTRLFDHLAQHCDAQYVFQSLSAQEAGAHGAALPHPARRTPWGTAHALLCARTQLTAPFAVINADDYYGRDAYKTLAAHLAAQGLDSTRHAMVGYPLVHTLSETGGVSRGICTFADADAAVSPPTPAVPAAGRLVRAIHEHTHIGWHAHGGRRVITAQRAEDCPPHAARAPCTLTGQEVASMNFFGFTPRVFEHLAACWQTFVQEARRAPQHEREYLLPAAVNSLIAQGKGTVRCYPSSAR